MDFLFILPNEIINSIFENNNFLDFRSFLIAYFSLNKFDSDNSLDSFLQYLYLSRSPIDNILNILKGVQIGGCFSINQKYLLYLDDTTEDEKMIKIKLDDFEYFYKYSSRKINTSLFLKRLAFDTTTWSLFLEYMVKDYKMSNPEIIMPIRIYRPDLLPVIKERFPIEISEFVRRQFSFKLKEKCGKIIPSLIDDVDYLTDEDTRRVLSKFLKKGRDLFDKYKDLQLKLGDKLFWRLKKEHQVMFSGQI